MELRGVNLAGNELTYDMLWQAYQKEKRSNELQLVPKTFYDDAQAFIGELASGTAEDGSSQKENASRLLGGIFERRKQKIFMYAAYGRQLPAPAPQRENTLYDGAVSLLNGSTLNSAGKAQKDNTLRATQAIPEVILPSGRKVGPLEKDQTLEVNEKEDRNFLINNNICREE